MGSFSKSMNAAKRAKRIGLLFSAAQIDYNLDPKLVGDIPDISVGDEVFSDVCGLISKYLAVQLSKAKRITFRAKRYTPTVFQIRYLGYKGVLMLHPELDKEKKHLAEFQKSMKKFTTAVDHTFSVVGHLRLYTFGRFNNNAASKAENRWIDAPIMDGLVIQTVKGELKICLVHPAPPEMEVMDWNIYDAGSTATATAMLEAIQRLVSGHYGAHVAVLLLKNPQSRLAVAVSSAFCFQ